MSLENHHQIQAQAFLLRKKLDKLKTDITKHRKPLELRIARTLFDARNDISNQNKVSKPKSYKSINNIRQRPAWGSGGGVTQENNKTGGWQKKEVFATPSQVNIEYDDAVMIGRSKEILTGPTSVVMGRDAKEILMMQSPKRLSEAYEYLKKENRDTEYPGLIPSETSSIYNDADSERDGEASSSSLPREVTVTVTKKIPRAGGYIPMRANTTSSDALKAEAHQWLSRGRELLAYRLEDVSRRMKEIEEKNRK